MSRHCDYSNTHACENEAGLRHFIKHGEIRGCVGCCPGCLNKDTCEYCCAYAKKALTQVQENAPAAPTFDFSALGDLSGQAEEADQQFDLHYGTAQDEYLISCIYLARVHALTAKAGRYGGGTWTKWYESKGLSEGSARSMVKNGDAFKSATVAELKCLPELTRKDLNLIARSGCAEQLTAAAGDSQRVQELLAQVREKDAHLEAAYADINSLAEQNIRLKDRATAAEAGKEKALEMQSKAEARAKDAEDALKHQPITAVVDEEEVDRRAAEKAWGLADARNRELQEENDRLKKNSAQLERRMKAVTSRMDDLGQTDFETANHCPEAMLAIWNSCKGSYSRLTGEDLENTFQYICNTLNSIRQEAALLCRQPEGYDGGAA